MTALRIRESQNRPMDETRTTLLVRLRDGNDQDAWRTFDELYRPLLLGFARSRGLETNDSEDVVQQCLEAVLKQIADYAHLGSFKNWLRGIVENKICDRFRSDKREVRADTGLFSRLPDTAETPEEEWERQWQMAHVRYCAECVRHEVAPSTYRAFVEYALEGRPADEVAADLGLTVNQVYVAKHRVVERMRKIMTELTGSAEGMP